MERFQSWLADLERRHLAGLRFSEVTRGLRALSSTYVERRASALAGHRALEGAGKRAAFALYYGPLHFLLTTAVLREVGRDPAAGLVVDLGCGTGASGAAAALATRPASRVIGVDVQMWAVEEARATYTALGLDGDVRPGALSRVRLPRDTSLIVVAFVANELRDDERRALLARLTEAVARGPALLVIEPIARRIAPWWHEWADHVRALGGRADEWRFALEPPPSVARLAHAAGLRPEELTARSLWVGPTPAAGRVRPAAPARRAREARRLPSR